MNFFKTAEKKGKYLCWLLVVEQQKKSVLFENLSKEESVKLFKELLREQGVTTSWRWDDAYRVVQTDPRSKCLKSISECK